MNEETAVRVLEIMKSQMKDFGMTAKYHGVGEMQESAVDAALRALCEIQQYRAIGTVDECLGAREKQRAKKRKLDSYCGFDSYECPICGTDVRHENNFCHKCGQRLE